MCGIAGIVSHQNVNQELYDALTVLQHRGQDAAGIATCEQGRFYLRKDNGLTRDVFSTEQMMKLRGNMGIAHVRYPTAGCSSSAEAQPFYVNSPFGLTLAHNGNLTNVDELKKQIFRDDQRHINTDSDSEILLNVFAHELQQLGKLRIDANDVFQAVSAVHQRCRGAYAVVLMIAGFGVLAFRDPHGIRPIVFGERKHAQGSDFMVASESVALDVLDFELIRDIEPGEAVFIETLTPYCQIHCANKRHDHRLLISPYPPP
jgi:amidophosphoribosyltransferase